MRLAAAYILAAFIACFQSAAAIDSDGAAGLCLAHRRHAQHPRRSDRQPDRTMELSRGTNGGGNQEIIGIQLSAYCRRGGKRSHRLRHRNRLSDHNGKQIKDAMWLYSVVDGDRLTSPVECVAELGNGSILIQKRRLKMHISVNLTRFLPSVFGGVRVYPQIQSTEITPGLHKIEDKKEILIF